MLRSEFKSHLEMTIILILRFGLLLLLCVATARVASQATSAAPTTSGRATCTFRLIAGFFDVFINKSELAANGTLYNTTRLMLQYHRIHRFVNLTMFTGQYSFPVRLSLYALEASVDATGTWRVRAINHKSAATANSSGSCDAGTIPLRVEWNASRVFAKSSSRRMTDATFEPLVAAESRTLCGVPLGSSAHCGEVDEKALALAIGELFALTVTATASHTDLQTNASANASSSSLLVVSGKWSAAPVPLYTAVVGNVSVNAKVLSRSFVTAGVQLAALLQVNNESVRAHSTLLNMVCTKIRVEITVLTIAILC